MSREPSLHYRGMYLPVEVVLLFKEGTISGSEMILLGLVDGLCEARGEGCFASNEYLSKWMGVVKKHLQAMLAKLQKMGLIIREERNGRRYLSVSWSHLYTCPGVHKGSENSDRGGQENLTHINKVNSIMGNAGKARSSPLGDAMGFFPTNPKGKQFTTKDKERAVLLHGAIASKLNRRVRVSLNNWANEFRLLRESLANDEARLDRVLHFYQERIANAKEHGLPTVTNANQFRKRFDWIEDRCNKGGTIPMPVLVMDSGTAPLLKQLQHYDWFPANPKKNKEFRTKILPSVLNESLFNYRKIRTDLKGLHERLQQGHVPPDCNERQAKVMLLVVERVLRLLPPPGSYVLTWAKEQQRKCLRWSEWNGQLKFITLSIHNKAFQEYFAMLVRKSHGDADKWVPLLLKQLGETHVENASKKVVGDR